MMKSYLHKFVCDLLKNRIESVSEDLQELTVLEILKLAEIPVEKHITNANGFSIPGYIFPDYEYEDAIWLWISIELANKKIKDLVRRESYDSRTQN